MKILHMQTATAVPSLLHISTDGDLQPKKHFQGDLDKVENPGQSFSSSITYW